MFFKSIRYLILSSIVISSNALYAQIIDRISIYGNNVIDTGTILSYTPFEDGDFYNEEARENISKALLATGFFKEILLEDDDNNLGITVVENPVIRKINLNLKGKNLINEKKMNDSLKEAGIIEGEIYNQMKLEEFFEKLKQTYKVAGYADAMADYKVKVDNNNLATIDLNISEEKVTKINNVSISGNNSFDSEKLLDLLTIGESDIFIINFFTKKDQYSEIKLDDSIAKLTNFYFDNGYLDFMVEDIKLNPIDEKIDIDIIIKEGPQYKVGKIDFTSPDFELTDEITFKTGDIFNRGQVIKSVKSITDTAANKGYAFAKIEVETVKKGKNIDIIFSLDQSKKVYINRIVINGNTRTQDSVLRRELGMVEGGLYSGEEINESIKRLKRLGFFQEVNLEMATLEGSDDRVDIIIEVVEDKTGRFSIGISHSNSTGVAFDVGVREANIFGTGNTLNAELSNSKAVRSIDLYFLNPYFNNKGHSVSYGLFSRSVDGSELKSSSYIVDKAGVTFGYGVPLSENSRIKLDTRLSKTDITCSAQFASSNYEAKQCAEKLSSEILTTLSYSYNSLNDFYFPTKGDRLKVSLGAALPFLDYSYAKFNTNYAKYIDIGNDLTLNLRTNVNIASGLSGKELPFFERYYGGGASSVRGFAFNSLGPQYPDKKSRGGELDVLGSVAIISPIKWIDDSERMRISAFVDFGGIYDKISSFDARDLRASAGLGFVWVTPLGPLGLYLSTPILSKDGDDIKKFDFTLGTTF